MQEDPVGLAMSYFRVPPVLEGETDPRAVARSLFGADRRGADRPLGTALDLGVLWQVLHYVLTGDPWDGPVPAADVVCGGRLLTEDGTDELGVDVVYLTPDRVKLAAEYLAMTPYDTLSDRFDPAAMRAADVQTAETLTPDDGATTIAPAHAALARFFQDAATGGESVYKVMRPA